MNASVPPPRTPISPSPACTPALVILVPLCLTLAAACDADRQKPAPSSSRPTPAAPAQSAAANLDRTRVSAGPRIVAIGDLHGDIAATRAALRLAGAIDANDHWSGGSLAVIQTGDQLDRGDDEQAIVDLFDALAEEAKRAGGAVYALNGNHEIMNVASDYRYVTEGGFRDFDPGAGLPAFDPRLSAFPPAARGRAGAFLPGAPYAKRLARRSTIVIAADTVFVHGGVLPAHVRYGLDRINREVSTWMNGDAQSPPSIAMGEDSPVWTRFYSGDADPRACEILGEALSALSVKRMVVGHTVQKGGISSACNDRVWRIDVGLSSHYGGPMEVLEITGNDVRVLRQSAGKNP
jgi:hypothetical protein